MRIYAAMKDRLLVVVSRRDGGWDTALRLEGAWPVCLAMDPSKLGRMYCGTFDRGLWRTTDAGETWEPVGEGVSGAAVTAVAVSATEQAGGYGVVYAGTEPSSLYRSEDGGETWRNLERMRRLPSSREWSFPPRPETSHVRAIALDPHSAGTVYAAIEAGALIRSFDGGETWEEVTDGLPEKEGRIASVLAANEGEPGVFYTLSNMGLYRSPDAGISWEQLKISWPDRYRRQGPGALMVVETG